MNPENGQKPSLLQWRAGGMFRNSRVFLRSLLYKRPHPPQLVCDYFFYTPLAFYCPFCRTRFPKFETEKMDVATTFTPRSTCLKVNNLQYNKTKIAIYHIRRELKSIIAPFLKNYKSVIRSDTDATIYTMSTKKNRILIISENWTVCRRN